MGTPEASPFASGITSGTMPAHWCANHLPVRPDSALDLVDHEEPFLAVADLAHLLEVAHVGDVDAALALEHLQQHGDHGGVALADLLDRGEVVVGHPQESAHQRLEAGLCLARAGGRKRRERAAVPGLLHHDDGGVLHAALVAVEARDLDGALVGFGARVAEEGVVHVRDRADLGRGALLLGHDEVVGDMDEALRLLGDRLRELRMPVAQAAHGDAGERVQVLLAVRIPEPGALAARERHRVGGVRVHHVR
jgi:hypothetical protein